MKKVLLCLLLMFSFLKTTYAYTFKGGDVISNMFIVKVKSDGTKEYKKAQFIIDGSGDYVYCLEPFVKVKTGATYNEHSSDFAKYLGISEDLWQKINLVAYYGYGYKSDTINHTDPKWYYITQVLIWRLTSPSSNFYFTNTYEGSINSTLYTSEINEIYNLVNNHFIIPEFSFPTAYKNDTISVIDKKGVLKNYKTDNKNISINGNILTIKLTDNNNFSLYKGTQSKPIVYVSSNSQNILKGSMEVPVKANYNVDAKDVTGKITIKKYGEVYNNNDYINEVLKDVYFTLTDEYGVYLQEKKTDSSGYIVFDNLKPGTYYIKETEKLEGYIKNEKEYKIVLELNSSNRVIDSYLEVHNTLEKGSLVIKKIDIDTKKPIKDAIFQIYKGDSIIYEGKTNEEGIIKLSNIPLGTYKIIELEPATGYKVTEATYEVTLDKNEEIKTIVIENELEKGSLIIEKIDKDIKEPIKDATFQIYKGDSIIYEGKTNEEGIIKLSNIPLGTYKIIELEPATGYKVTEATYEVTLDKNEEVKTIVIENELEKGSLILKKIDFDTKEPIMDVLFHIYYKDELINEVRTLEDGVIRLDNLELGTYKIVEVEAATGYKVTEATYEVTLDKDKETKTMIIENEKQKGSLVIKKYDVNTYEVLPDTTFQIISNGEVIKESTTDIEGIIRVDSLVLGDYLIKEIKASNGYILNTEDILVKLDKEEVMVEIFNIPDTYVSSYNIIYFWDKDKDRLKKSILF